MLYSQYDHSQNSSDNLRDLKNTKFEALSNELVFSPIGIKTIHRVLQGVSQQFEGRHETQEIGKKEFSRIVEGGCSSGFSTRQFGDLVVLPNGGETYFFSDCEGSYRALLRFIDHHQVIKELTDSKEKESLQLVFLGDSIDRSKTSLPFLELLLILRKAFPRQVHVLAGNHELSSSQQTHQNGLFIEIANREMALTASDWRTLKHTPFFRDYFRGNEYFCDGLAWKITAENRAQLYREYLEYSRAIIDRNSQLRPTSEYGFDVDGSLNLSDHSFELGVSDEVVLLRQIREKIAKYFLWDICQVWFSQLPLAAVSNSAYASHALFPTTGVFESEVLRKGDQRSSDLLFTLSRISEMPEERQKDWIDDMIWSDLITNESVTEDRQTAIVSENIERGGGKIVNEAAADIFLQAIDRQVLIRGHQRLGSSGYAIRGAIHTIQSSARSGGACLKLTASASRECPMIERMDFR